MDTPICRHTFMLRSQFRFSAAMLRRYSLSLAILLATCSLLVAEDIAPGKSGEELISFLQSHYRPTNSLGYRGAREKMFGTIDNRDGKVRCVYTGTEIATSGIPNVDLMNTEHTWPQSKFDERLPMKADLHHLFPTVPKVNEVRGNLPFADIPDTQTMSWWNSNRPTLTAPAETARNAYSESISNEFEPREDHKGNVARAVFYMWVVYRDDNITASWIEPQLTILRKWHEADPADDRERDRSQQIKTLQGNENPFVADPTLVARVLPGTVPHANRSLALAASATVQPRQRTHRFPDFKLEYRPPQDQFPGRLFRLSQDFPSQLPPIDDKVKAILDIPYDENGGNDANWLKYLLAVRDYCFEGNTDCEWQGQDNKVRPWFHVPWQHYGEKGREGIHGLTREASAKPQQLAPTQVTVFQTHAVAMYNARGGYTIGKVWENQFEPDVTKARFPPGTVVVKILFTQAQEIEVPYLRNPLVWKAYVQDPRDATKRSIQNLRLLQMDVMVRDERAEKTGGWVFGTYCYNGNLENEVKWLNLVPVGIQWGNDPNVKSANHNPTNPQPQATQVNGRLKQSIISTSSDLPAQHLGWGGRLNGPADYYRSSCMSCHATAQYPVLAPQHPDFKPGLEHEPGSDPWMVWFRNLACGASFTATDEPAKKATSMDFSLQLAIGIDNFYLWKSSVMGGYFTPIVPGDTPSLRTETFRPTSEVPRQD